MGVERGVANVERAVLAGAAVGVAATVAKVATVVREAAWVGPADQVAKMAVVAQAVVATVALSDVVHSLRSRWHTGRRS